MQLDRHFIRLFPRLEDEDSIIDLRLVKHVHCYTKQYLTCNSQDNGYQMLVKSNDLVLQSVASLGPLPFGLVE